MKVLDLSIGRPAYEVEVQASLLFEAALGLAAVTYDEIRDTLERKTPEWEEILRRMKPEAQQEVEYCAKHNTWQTLLRLLHGGEFTALEAFLQHLRSMTVEQLRYQVLPALCEPREEELRRLAAAGDKGAADILIAAAAGHGFLAAYVPFILNVDGEVLKRHLLLLTESWYEAAISPRETEWAEILMREVKVKREMQGRLSREAFVEWTIGKAYQPDPGLRRVLLVPNIAYRPWTIQADLPGTRVFYYPVSEESLFGDDDPYRPPASLVLLHKALGDENRLRLLKLLDEGERTLQELTVTLDLAKSTVHHHLALLRSAGLVVSDGSTYALRPALLQQMERQLAAYFERGGQGG
ncbi:ArsR family transcriptional regulator [Tumebacillus sp. BK434]|uniref:ArsR/SmtB family transcription factor n=1 Tax=Tumebacillus sp. BK434 TaxID=2512169 RepID=UPI001053CB08|nr:metalloregulator ArsR/SmtB family transcription factor [Tumebacillus sp. BK434]TCP59202.1 ArsR family transcriptional regulator [Tumebacillus sp. BK434]